MTSLYNAGGNTHPRQMNINNLNKTSSASADLQNGKYEILGKGCSKLDPCLVTIYLGARFFNEKNMKEIANQLSLQFKDKKVINVDIFDDKELAIAHVTNNAEPQERQLDRRGWYFRYNNQEVLLFKPDKKDQSKFIRINLKQDD
jgi:hypothetical protein